jgi:hypothetical protein
MLEIIESISRFQNVTAEAIPETALGPTPIFVVRVLDEGTLRENWRAISNTVAAGYQSLLKRDQEFERWNIYLLFICNGPVSWQLEGMIETDKFSSRKIVISGEEAKLSVQELIDRYVTGTSMFKTRKVGAATKAQVAANAISKHGELIKGAIGENYIDDRQRPGHRKQLNELLEQLEEIFSHETKNG